ncbi:hypothetical protein WK57_27590 [Burkholderia ubonensis]|uniref:Multidrug transporter n=2 Tax=Burkholderia ubonensis TaxID=101571 RepID=A0AA40UUB2_9BURK|nr:hypothetical protein WK57_27590 [Burkholderia ubonensis]
MPAFDRLSAIKPSVPAGAAALLLAACTMAPHYQRPDAPVSGAFPSDGVYATQPRANGSRSANGQAAADIGWRNFFADRRLQALIEIALKNNRDLRVSVLNIEAARAAFFPKISLTAAFGTASPTLGGLFKPGTAAWSFAPNLALPIFEGGANLANLDLAHVQKRIEIANYEKAIQRAFREVSDGLAARGTYDQQIAALQRNEQAQQRRYALSDLRYRKGVDSYLTVLTAQTDLYTAQTALISARLDRWTNLVDLYRALGGGWIEHTGDRPRETDARPATAG